MAKYDNEPKDFWDDPDPEWTTPEMIETPADRDRNKQQAKEFKKMIEDENKKKEEA